MMPAPYHGAHHGYISNFLSTGETGIIGTGRELVGMRKNGSIFPMDLSVSEMEIHGRRSFTGIVRDITERKQAEDELRQLATIVESVNDPIVAIDSENKITVWNPAAEELYGYTTEDVLGETLKLITPPDGQAVQASRAAIALDGQPVAKFDTHKITKSGRLVDVSIAASPIFDQYGVVVGAVGIHRDMTEQKRAEGALRDSEERYNTRLLEEKNRAEENQVRKTQQLQTIFKIGEVLAGPGDFQTKVQWVSTIVREHLDVDVVTLRMLDKQAGALDLVAWDGLRFDGLTDSLSLAVDGFSQRVFLGRQNGRPACPRTWSRTGKRWQWLTR